MTEATTRPIPTYVDDDGVPHARMYHTPSHDTERCECAAPPPIVVPIVFVPGVMGSNLKASDQIRVGGKEAITHGERVWNVDKSTSPASWFTKGPSYRQAVLNKDAVVVDNSGHIAQENGFTPRSRIALKEAKTRGWGSPGWGFYGDFLDWLDYQLNQGRLHNEAPDGVFEQIMNLTNTTPEGAQSTPDRLTKDQIKKTLDIWFPVYAVGYNWLQSNLTSGQDLLDGRGKKEDRVLGIKEIVDRHNNGDGQTCEQVIVVTHSMGGLVARAAAFEPGAGDLILGIVHGVNPADGAAKFYKDIAAGFAGDDSGIAGWMTSHVLGNTAREATPEIAYNPGPLELAPNQRYNGGNPWLFIKNPQGDTLKALPESGDPYEEVYKDTEHVWRAVNPDWLNPTGSVARPEIAFKQVVDKASGYHYDLGGKLHPRTYAHWGDDKNHSSWGDVTWKASAWGSLWHSARPDKNSNIDQWEMAYSEGQTGRDRTTKHGVVLSIEEANDSGDGTVPATASGAQIANYSGCKVACALTGFEHQDDYNQQNVRNVLLDAIVRLTEPVKLT